MRKIFVDLGSHSGQTLLLAIQKFPKLDLYIGVEPVFSLYEKSKLDIPNLYRNKTKIFNIAVDVLDVPKKKIIFYEDTTKGNNQLGSSIFSEKTMKTNKKITVDCEDINSFFNNMFIEDDNIILKIDIEGKEYDILEALMKSGNLKKYVTELYVEWHYKKVSCISRERHRKIIKDLNKLGYKVSGDSTIDEFYKGL